MRLLAGAALVDGRLRRRIVLAWDARGALRAVGAPSADDVGGCAAPADLRDAGGRGPAGGLAIDVDASDCVVGPGGVDPCALHPAAPADGGALASSAAALARLAAVGGSVDASRAAQANAQQVVVAGGVAAMAFAGPDAGLFADADACGGLDAFEVALRARLRAALAAGITTVGLPHVGPSWIAGQRPVAAGAAPERAGLSPAPARGSVGGYALADAMVRAACAEGVRVALLDAWAPGPFEAAFAAFDRFVRHLLAQQTALVSWGVLLPGPERLPLDAFAALRLRLAHLPCVLLMDAPDATSASPALPASLASAGDAGRGQAAQLPASDPIAASLAQLYAAGALDACCAVWTQASALVPAAAALLQRSGGVWLAPVGAYVPGGDEAAAFANGCKRAAGAHAAGHAQAPPAKPWPDAAAQRQAAACPDAAERRRALAHAGPTWRAAEGREPRGGPDGPTWRHALGDVGGADGSDAQFASALPPRPVAGEAPGASPAWPRPARGASALGLLGGHLRVGTWADFVVLRPPAGAALPSSDAALRASLQGVAGATPLEVAATYVAGRAVWRAR